MQRTNIGVLDVIRSSGSFKIKAIKLADLILGGALACILLSKKENKLPATITKLLVIRPGGIGDAVFLLPILKNLRGNNPSLKIAILCEKRNAEIFLSQPQLNLNVYRYDRSEEFKKVSKQKYDVVIDTEQWHYLSALVSYFLPSAATIGFATRPLRKKLFTKPVSYKIDAYELENFAKLFEAIGIAGNPQDINGCYDVSLQKSSWAAEQIQPQSVTVFLGASIPERRLTQEQRITLINSLLKQNLNIILLGGKDVQDSSNELEKDLASSRVKNFVGKISLEESAALIQKSQLFIGPDSGLMHLACAVGTPVIAIFGPGNLKKWGPKGEQHSIITENVECAPCTLFGYTIPTCGGRYQCTRELDMKKLHQAILKYVR